MERIAHIYGIRAKTANEPFYIGSTRDTITKRFANHQYQVNAGKHNNKHFANKCKKIGFDEIIIEAIETVAIENQFVREHEIINEYLARGVQLTNIRLVPWAEQTLSLEDYYTYPPVFQSKILTRLQEIKSQTRFITSDPRNQRLYDRMSELVDTILESLVTKHASGFCAMMRGEECP